MSSIRTSLALLRRLSIAALVVLAMTVAACGDDAEGVADAEATTTTAAPTTTRPAPPPVMVGPWESGSLLPHSVSFVVVDDAFVTEFHMVIDGSCDIRIDDPAVIDENGTFVFGAIDDDGEPIESGIVGTFESPDIVTGTFANPFRCGTASSYTEMYLPNNEWSASFGSK